jgi:hypothetical protein
MTSRDFCYWLQGFFEVGEPGLMTEDQVACIKKHLALVFKHEIDPSFGDEKKQADLNKIHTGKPPIGGPPGPGGVLYRC